MVLAFVPGATKCRQGSPDSLLVFLSGLFWPSRYLKLGFLVDALKKIEKKMIRQLQSFAE